MVLAKIKLSCGTWGILTFAERAEKGFPKAPSTHGKYSVACQYKTDDYFNRVVAACIAPACDS